MNDNKAQASESGGKPRRRPVIAVLAGLAALALAAMSGGNPQLFFGAGALLLTSGILFTRHAMGHLATATSLDSASDLALRNTTRRSGRSLATIGVLASGVFMVVAVDSFRKTGTDDTTGTGGFALVGESASPIYEDLNSQKGRDAYALDDKLMDGVRVVQMRVRDGDDASCLNLNRAVQPRIVGVKFLDLGDGATRIFMQARSRAQKEDEMGTLNAPLCAWGANIPHFGIHWNSIVPKDSAAIPGVVDANTLQWALQKSVGDKLDYTDERGQPLAVEMSATLKGSMMQGLVLIPEARFIEKFPNSAGYRFFLIDCPPAKAAAVREHLTAQLGDRGLELVPTAQRLAEFNAVENTYLSIFQVLGGLGILLGSAGLGIVVARNVLERRREFGLLEAVGFNPAQLRALVFAEHRWLIVAALGIGSVSAIVAVSPGILQKGASFPWGQLSILFVGMAALSVFWVWLATRLALRGSQLSALRGE